MRCTSTPTRRAVGLRPTVFLLPYLVPLHEHGFDLFFAYASVQFLVPQSPGQICRRIVIGMGVIATDDTAKRLLVRTIGAIGIVTYAALLGGVRALNFYSSHSPLCRLPGDLFGDACEIGCAQIGIHRTRLKLHGSYRKLFVGDLSIGVLVQAHVDRAINLLAHM